VDRCGAALKDLKSTNRILNQGDFDSFIRPLLDAIRNETNLSRVVQTVFSQFALFVKDFATREEYSQWETLSSTWRTCYPDDLAASFNATIGPIHNEYIQFRSSLADLESRCHELGSIGQGNGQKH
jgi:hypothetical protein